MIILYSKSNPFCPACDKAKRLLTSLGIEFKVVDISSDFQAFDFMIDEGHRTMPQIYKDGKVFIEGGYAGLEKAHAEGKI